MSHMYTDVYIGTEIDNLIANILLSMYHTKAEVDDTHNELPTLIRFFFAPKRKLSTIMRLYKIDFREFRIQSLR